jgi:hypothetical protein
MTVEELRERLRYVTPSAWYGVIDEIISTAHAEGVAEGINKERDRLWMERWHVPQTPDERFVIIGVKAFCPTVPASKETKTVSHHDGPVTTSECTIENAGYVERTISGKKP